MATVTDAYEDFASIGRRALDVVASRRGRELQAAERDAILGSMLELPAHPEVPDALLRLRSEGFPLATLTNSSPEMARAQLEHAGILDLFDQSSRLRRSVVTSRRLSRTGWPPSGSAWSRPTCGWSPPTTGTSGGDPGWVCRRVRGADERPVVRDRDATRRRRCGSLGRRRRDPAHRRAATVRPASQAGEWHGFPEARASSIPSVTAEQMREVDRVAVGEYGLLLIQIRR